jgi:hypothetical protein
VALFCSNCGSGELHLSHLRGRDLGQLLVLRLPVRCYTCMHRDYVSIFSNTKVKRARKRRSGLSSNTQDRAAS